MFFSMQNATRRDLGMLSLLKPSFGQLQRGKVSYIHVIKIENSQQLIYQGLFKLGE